MSKLAGAGFSDFPGPPQRKPCRHASRDLAVPVLGAGPIPIVWSSGGDSPQDPYSPYSPLPVLADDGAARRAVCGGYLRDKKEADGLRAPSRATARKAAHGAASIAQRCLPTSLSPISRRRRTSARPPHSSRSRGAPSGKRGSPRRWSMVRVGSLGP